MISLLKNDFVLSLAKIFNKLIQCKSEKELIGGVCHRYAKKRNFSVTGQAFMREAGNYDPDGKTSITILNKDLQSGLMIDGYSQVGFRLNNNLTVVGPMIIFPRSVLCWDISGAEAINEESLSLFFKLEPKLDILLIGVDGMPSRLDLQKRIITLMDKTKMNIELLTTEKACAMYNFLCAERRYVAAALTPIRSVFVPADVELREAERRRSQLEQSDE